MLANRGEKHRPKICDVKRDLSTLAEKDNIFDKATDQDARTLVKQRNLKTKLSEAKPLNIICIVKQWCEDIDKTVNARLNTWPARLIIGIIIIILVINRFDCSFQNSGAIFLLSDGKYLVKYDIASFNHSYLPEFPKTYQEQTTVQNFVKVNDIVYVISCVQHKAAIQINVSDPVSKWRDVKWSNMYKNKKYISVKDSILAIGTQSDYMNFDCQNTIPGPSATAFMYNTTTKTWTDLPSMSEARLGPALVVYDGLACAVGGSASPSVECFNMSRNQWISLPMMNITRRDAAAVELNGELYVIGGALFFDLKHLDDDEIRSYYSRYALSSVEKYNPVTNTWSGVTKLHEGRIYHGAGVANGKIYVVGGFSSVVEVYDPDSNVWRIGDTVFNAQRYHRIIAISLSNKDVNNKELFSKLQKLGQFLFEFEKSIRKSLKFLVNLFDSVH